LRRSLSRRFCTFGSIEASDVRCETGVTTATAGRADAATVSLFVARSALSESAASLSMVAALLRATRFPAGVEGIVVSGSNSTATAPFIGRLVYVMRPLSSTCL
jgi:hypothetical protein